MRSLEHSKAMRCTALVFSAIIFAQAAVSRGQSAGEPGTQPDNTIKIGERLVMHSAVLQEDRPYLVYLPQSYQNKAFAPKRYPVLYLLDGDLHFHSASGVVQYLGAAIHIPELIVVALPNTQRTRDLTPTHAMKEADGKETPAFASSGGGPNFLRFLSEELIPKIERQYRTEPYRILVGHSLGGLFATYAFLQRPQIFQAYIAIDPSLWWDDEAMCRQARIALERTNDLRGTVYISLANNPLPKGKTVKPGERAGREFAALLQAHQIDSFRSTMQYFEAEDHGSVPLPSLYYGLRFIFDGYKPPVAARESAAGIRDHFAKASARLGFTVLPPETYVNDLGWYYLSDQQQTNAAFEFLNLNVLNYPLSPNVHESLAEAYQFIGNKTLAAENFRMALKANPENRYAAERLRRLKPPSEKACGPLGDGVYCMINKANGKSLEAATNSPPRPSLRLLKYAGEPCQQWRFLGEGDGYYQVTALQDGKALDVNALSLRNGASVIVWNTNGGANQSWQLVSNPDGTYRLLNEHSGLALQFAKPVETNGTTLQQSEWRGLDSQKWRLKKIAGAGER
jgi:predicted alpha/beta superfamily hydrolase